MPEKTIAPAATYRPEIDGLRAVSILAVVLYHARVPGFEAGYLGVDVFFVISGFLITDQLLREARSSGTIQIAAFYARRVRRLLPAFATMAIGTTLLVLWCLPPLTEQRLFGNALSRSAFFYYNIAAWRGGYDYENPAAQQQVLMHTWSLGVEEQFYLFWPWLCLAFLRLRRPLAGFAGLVVVSLLGLAWVLPRDPEGAFFLLPFRVWELGLGACLAIRTRPPRTEFRTAGTLVGLVCVVGGLLTGEQRPPDGWDQALVGVGAVCVIAFGAEPNSASAFLRAAPMVALGRASYAWYLWHWPLLVISRLGRPDIDAGSAGPALALGAILTGLTHFLVERPALRIRIVSPWKALAVGFAGLLTLALCGFVIEQRSKRLAARPENAAVLKRFARAVARPCEGDVAALGCDLSPTPNVRKPVLLLWGDSFARSLAPALSNYSAESGTEVRLLAKSGCPPLLGSVPAARMRPLVPDSSCDTFVRAVSDRLRLDPSDVSGVLLVASWSGLVAGDMPSGPRRLFDQAGREIPGPTEGLSLGLHATLDVLGSLGLRTLIVGVPPAFPFEVGNCLLSGHDETCVVDRHWQEAAREQTRAVFQRLVQKNQDAKLVELFDPFCPGARCSVGTLDAPLFSDKSHLSKTGAERALPVLVPFLDWLGERVPKQPRGRTDRAMTEKESRGR